MEEIKGFEGRYMVDTDGNIYSILNQKQRTKPPELRKQSTHRTGYKQLALQGPDGKRVIKLVHRLVAEAFLPNPNNHPQVDHIDGDKGNNCITNLQWVTAQMNCEKAHSHVYYLQHLDGTGVFVKNLLKWCREKGINHSNLYQMQKGNQAHCSGYTSLERVYG